MESRVLAIAEGSFRSPPRLGERLGTKKDLVKEELRNKEASHPFKKEK